MRSNCLRLLLVSPICGIGRTAGEALVSSLGVSPVGQLRARLLLDYRPEQLPGALRQIAAPQTRPGLMIMPQSYVGVDVSKSHLDIHWLETGRSDRQPNTDKACAKLAEALAGSHVIFEATGGYEMSLALALAKAETVATRLNPRLVRRFAQASGILAKTDRIDAEVLARFGERMKPDPTCLPRRVCRQLDELVSRRCVLLDMALQETNRLENLTDPWLKRAIRASIRSLGKQLDRINTRIAETVAGDTKLAALDRRLQTLPGIGPVTSHILLARMPELGRMDRRQAASLAGLAPHACDSGTMRGRRMIWGGRTDLRRALYLAARSAALHHPPMRAKYDALRAAGKPYKVAIIAIARRLITIANHMIKHDHDYQSDPI